MPHQTRRAPRTLKTLGALTTLGALIALGALSALLPLAAHAASFDCAKAKSPSEKLICSDAALGALDERLAAAYKSLVAQLTEAEKKQLKETQRSWLKSWPLLCSATPSAKQPTLGAGALPCAKARYEERLGDLKTSKGFAGGRLLVYTHALYSAIPVTEMDTPPVSEEGAQLFFARHTLRSARVSEAGLSGDDLALVKAANAWLAPTASELSALKSDSSETTTTLTLTGPTPALWCASVSTQGMEFGAAHENNFSEDRWFWVAQRRPLVAADVFGVKGWQKTLAQLAFGALKASIPDDLDVEGAQVESFVTLVSSPARWSFTREGLELNFNAYDVASYAAGPQSVVVPWAPLEALLTPSFKEARKGLR